MYYVLANNAEWSFNRKLDAARWAVRCAQLGYSAVWGGDDVPAIRIQAL